MTALRYYDVSHFQGAYKPTGPTVAKATQGRTFTDPEFAGIRARTLAGGWPFLAYHFLAHANIATQVAHVIDVIGRGQPLMLDVESQPGAADSELADVYAFADRYAAVSGGGQVTLAYIPEWYWRDHWGAPRMTGLTDRGVALVSSYYTTYSDTGPGWREYAQTRAGVVFTSGVKPAIWQYTSRPLDTNAFKGTQAQLAALWNGGTRNPDNPVQEPDMPLTQADADLVVDTLMKRGLGNDGNPIVAVALDRAAQAFTIDALMKQPLGNSGPVVAVALQSTYQMVTAIQAALNPATLAGIVAQAVEIAGVDVPAATLQTALVGALKELAAAAPPAAV